MRLTKLHQLTLAGLCLIAAQTGITPAFAAPVTWNGWSFDYEVGGVNKEGLILKNVKYKTHSLLKKVSLPAIEESAGGAPGDPNPQGCRKTVNFDGVLAPMPWANNATVSQRQFNKDGRLWYEIGIYKIISTKEYFQAYYLSADGLFDMRLYGKGAICSGFYTLDQDLKWRIDVDVDGPDNDLMSSRLFTPYLNEGGQNGAGTTASVRDKVTNNSVNIFNSLNMFSHPDGTQTLNVEGGDFDYFEHYFPLLYRASEDTGAGHDLDYINGENINGKDLLSWHARYYPLDAYGPSNDIWRASGVTLAPSWAPNYLPDVVVKSVSYADDKFYVTLQNRGIGPTPAGKSVGVGIYVDGAYKTWQAVSRLMPGETRGINLDYDSHSTQPYVMPDGDHVITAWVDDINRFAELDENNNKLSDTVNLTTNPSLLRIAKSTRQAIAITSPGVDDSGFIHVSGSTVIVSAKSVRNVTFKNVTLQLLNNNSGKTTLFTKRTAPYVFSWDSTTVPTGSYTLSVIATDTTGNTWHDSVKDVLVYSPASITRPDLVVTNVAYANGQFSCTVKNAGTADIPAAALMVLGFYVDGVNRNWTSSYGPLAAGASVNLVSKGAAYTIPAGSHALKAYIDDINLVMEGNEANNTLSKTITVP